MPLSRPHGSECRRGSGSFARKTGVHPRPVVPGAVWVAASLLLFLGCSASGQTAIQALKLLPKERAAKLVRIIGEEGTPAPKTWKVLVEDPAAPHGLHEYVVAGTEIIASRALLEQPPGPPSAAATINPADVEVDSEAVGKLAEDYASANDVILGRVDYELQKVGPDAVPVWNVRCHDESGAPAGELVVTATKGVVVSHLGLPIPPPPAGQKPMKLEIPGAVEPSPSADPPRPDSPRKPAANSAETAPPEAPPVKTKIGPPPPSRSKTTATSTRRSTRLPALTEAEVEKARDKLERDTDAQKRSEELRLEQSAKQRDAEEERLDRLEKAVKSPRRKAELKQARDELDRQFEMQERLSEQRRDRLNKAREAEEERLERLEEAAKRRGKN